MTYSAAFWRVPAADPLDQALNQARPLDRPGRGDQALDRLDQALALGSCFGAIGHPARPFDVEIRA